MSEKLENRPQTRLPDPVIRRLPRYLIGAQELEASGATWVSSVELGHALGLTSSTVRQDLSHLDVEGVSKRGYEIAQLSSALTRTLRADRKHRVVLVGAGLLGRAIALHGDLTRYGFEVAAVMDVNPEIIGTSIGNLKVQPMSALPDAVAREHIDIGVIAVPAPEAQAVADALVAMGILALLNLALVQLKVPDSVQVVEERIVVSLQELAYRLRTSDGERNVGAS